MSKVTSQKKTSSMRTIALATTVLTGFTGLVYEVTWHKYLANILGSQAQATAIILASFLGGLCIGYFIFGRFSKNRAPSSLLKTIGWAEVFIGVWAILFPDMTDALWSFVVSMETGTFVSRSVEILGCVILLAIPTICMGGTLPLLTQGLSQDLADSSTFHSQVYAINTGGAFLGCLLAGFIILPTLGLPITLLYMALINIIAGFVLIAIGNRLPKTSNETQPAKQKQQDESQGKIGFLPACCLAFLAGLYSIALQTVFIRLTGLSLGSSEYAFSMVVAVYIFLLAYGAWKLVGKEITRRSLWVNQLILLISALVVYLTVPYWGYVNHFVRSMFSNQIHSFYIYHILMFLVLGFLLAIPVGMMGRTMPILFGITKSNFSSVGDTVGRLYSWNTLGCVFGAIFGGYLALFVMDLYALYLLCCSAIVVSVAISFPWHNAMDKNYRFLPALAIGATLVFTVMIPRWDSSILGIGSFRKTTVNDLTFSGAEQFYKKQQSYNVNSYKDGPNTTILIRQSDKSIPENSEKFFREIFVNGKSDGLTTGPDKSNMYLSAHIPALLHKSPSKKAAVIGFGTGMSIGALDRYEELESIHIYEISPTIKETSELFDFASANSSRNPKVSWKIGDAFKKLINSKEKYSVIMSEPSNPWVTGVERIFSKEFLELASHKLDEGGIYAQWLQTYAISPSTFGMVVNTYLSVFEEFHIFYASPGDMILVGSKNVIDQSNFEAMKDRFSRTPIKTHLQEIGITSWQEILGRESWLNERAMKNFAIHTLEFPKLSYAAGIDFFLRKTASLDSHARSIQWKPWYHAKAPKTLLRKFALGTDLEKYHNLSKALPGLCGTSKESISPQFVMNAPYRCRQSSVELVKSGDIPLNKVMRESDELYLSLLFGTEHKVDDKKMKSPESQVRLATLLNQFGGYPFNSKAEYLFENRDACYASDAYKVLKCMSETAKTLASFGYMDLAKIVTDEIHNENSEKTRYAKNEATTFIDNMDRTYREILSH